MINSTSHQVTKHHVELSEAEVKTAIIEYLANRRPHMCPLELAEDAKAVLKEEGSVAFKIKVEKQETRNGPSGEMVDVTIVEFTRDVRTP